MRIEMNATSLIYTDPERNGSMVIVTNDSLFKMLADCCGQQSRSSI